MKKYVIADGNCFYNNGKDYLPGDEITEKIFDPKDAFKRALEKKQIIEVDAKPGKDDAGKDDAGKDDAGKDDAGKADAGKADAGKDDAGKDDAGKADAGKDDAGKADTEKNKGGK